MSETTSSARKPVVIWFVMMGIGLVGYSIFAFIPGFVGGALGLFVPGIVAALVWINWDKTTNLEEAGIVAGLLSGVGAMAIRLVLPPSVEWFSYIDMIPEHFKALGGAIPIPLAYGMVGYITTKIVARIRRGRNRRAAKRAAPETE
jgi:hypothetical protein